MTAPIVHLDEDLADVVERVCMELLDGSVVLLPTDTVYGIVALPGLAAATDRLFALKGRDADTPLAVLCTDLSQAVSLAAPGTADGISAVGTRWWPGPLTLVVPRRAGIELHLGEPATTVGLRVPDHALVRAVAARVGPVAATSANRHGEPTPSTAVAAAAALTSGIALVVDGGTLEGTASTVINAVVSPWVVLRDGPIPGLEVVRVAGAPTDGGR